MQASVIMLLLKVFFNQLLQNMNIQNDLFERIDNAKVVQISCAC